MIPYELEPQLYIPVAVAIALLVIARIHASPRWWCPSMGLFWNPLRMAIWPAADHALARVPFLYAKTRVNRDEYAATLEISIDELRDDLSNAGYEVQPLSSLARDWDGRIERGSFARYYGKRLFPRAPDWLRRKQVHVRPFGRDGSLDVTAHTELNPWRPDLALPHMFGIGLEAAPEMVADDLDIRVEEGPR